MEKESVLSKQIALTEEEKRISQEENCAISILPDDCLIKIFENLAIADRIRIERVCRKWQYLSMNSWQNFKKLDCSFSTWGFMRYPPKSYHTIHRKTLKKVVQLCGRYLTSVCLSTRAFRNVCLMTKNIRELRLFDILPHVVVSTESIGNYEMSHWRSMVYDCECDASDWKKIVKWFLINGQKITKLELSLCHTFYQDEDFSKLFLAMTNLKSFYLTDCSKMNFVGHCLKNLPFDSIDEICLINVQNLENDLMSSMIKKCKKLQKLCLYRLFGGGIDLIINALVSQADTLTNVNLRISGSFGRKIEDLPQILSNISQLKHLVKLDFVNAPGFVNDNTLRVIAENCIHLTRLNIAGENYVTDKGIRHIVKLRKLTYLDIRDIARIKNPLLEEIHNLEILNCSHAVNLREECIIRLLKRTQNLRAINCRQCPLLTTKVAHVADDVMKSRGSNKALDIYIERNKVSDEFCFRKHPLLNIVVGAFSGLKYGCANILLSDRIPQVRICPYPTGE